MTETVSAKGRRQPYLVGENRPADLWGDRVAAAVVLPQISALIAAGYGFHATVGALTTPVVGGGNGTVLDATEPELVISVPRGTAIMPINIQVQCEVPADQDGDVQEAVIIVDRTAQTTSIGAGVTEVAFNLRTDNPRTSMCDVYSAVTTDIVPAMTQSFELCRRQLVVNIVTSGITHGYLDMIYNPRVKPIIVGPASVFVLFGGTQGMSGYVQADWVELPPELNALWGGS